MSRSAWVIVGAALALLSILTAVGAATGVLDFEPDRDGTSPTDAPIVLPDDARDPGLEPGAAEPMEIDDDDAALPAPVDLDAVDRERDLHGVVVDRTGDPIAGATLETISHPFRHQGLLDRQDETRAGPTTMSAIDGTFALRLDRGDVVSLRANASGFAQATLPDLQAGGRVRVVLRRPSRLVVTAVAPGGEPAPGLELRLSGRGLSPSLRTTDARGTATFDQLPSGETVYVRPLPKRAGWGRGRSTRVVLPGAREHAVTIELLAGRTIEGTVVDDRSGEPIQGARVGHGWGLEAAEQTDEAGRYVLHGWTGTWGLGIHVVADGYARAQVEVGDQETVDFALVPGFDVVGRVVRAGGEPFEGAVVAAIGYAPIDGERKLSMDHRRSDGDGRFALTSLRADMAHTLAVHARGLARAFVEVTPPVDGRPVDLGDVVLSPARAVAGAVATSAGEVLPDVVVELEAAKPDANGTRYGRRWSRRTDDLGRFRFDDLPPGHYRISTRRSRGSARLEQSVELTADDETKRVDLVLAATRKLTVRVTDTEATPVVDAGVSARGDSTGPRPIESRTDESGVAVLEVPIETVAVSVLPHPEQSLTKPERQTLGPEVPETTFVLEPGAITKGVLIAPDDRPLPLATLTVTFEGKELSIFTAADGAFRVKSPLDVLLQFAFDGLVIEEDDGGGRRLARVGMKARAAGIRAGSTDVVLRATAVDPGGTFRVRVLDPDGKPMAGMRVSIPTDSGIAQAPTDQIGWTTITGVPRKPVRVGVDFQSTADRPFLPPPRQLVDEPDGVEVVLRMQSGALIRGSLESETGTPEPEALVEVRRDDGRHVSRARTDQDGRFVAVVPSGDPGPFVLGSAARRRSGARVSAQADGVAPGATDVRLRYAPVK